MILVDYNGSFIRGIMVANVTYCKVKHVLSIQCISVVVVG